jgi:hypothetical protein
MSVRRILSRFWAKGALARKPHHLGPSLRRNPLPVIEAGLPSRATGHGPPKKIATFNNHTEAPEPMAGALWTSYDASFPAIWVEAMKKPSRAGGKPAKAQRRKALKLKGRNAPRAAPRRSSSRIGQIEVARAPLATSVVIPTLVSHVRLY